VAVDYDVVVVGASLAGCATATLLGRAGGVALWTRYGWIRPPMGEDFAYPRYGYDIRREKLDPMVRSWRPRLPGWSW
jgi:choline dehydrogenase-like flavoprotein